MNNHQTITRRIIAGVLVVGVIILTVLGVRNYIQNPDISGRQLTPTEERSLIDTQRTALLSNAKPKDIFATLSERYDQLSDEGKAVAVEIMYISQQNAALYYNNMMYIMGGEISVNRPADSMNSLDAGKGSAWVAGYIQDLEDQMLVPINLNEDMILALPNFKALEPFKQDATPSLRKLIDVGVKIQDLKPFTSNYFNIHSAALSFDIAINAYQEVSGTNADAYSQHILSLARLMHDAIFGFIQTNNIEWQLDVSGNFLVSDEQLKGMEMLADSDFALQEKAVEYLKEMEGQTISSQFIQERSIRSVREFGQSVYISSAADIDNYYTVSSEGDVKPNDVNPAHDSDEEVIKEHSDEETTEEDQSETLESERESDE